VVIGATSQQQGEADSPAIWSHLIHLNEHIWESQTVNKHSRYRVWYYKCIEQYIITELLQNVIYRGKSPNMGRCIISYQEVLSSLLKNGNHQADEALLCNHSTNSQLLWTSVLSGHLCFGALWNFCLSLNCDSWAVEGKLFFWITEVWKLLDSEQKIYW
jgi:hypothetical protein